MDLHSCFFLGGGFPQSVTSPISTAGILYVPFSEGTQRHWILGWGTSDHILQKPRMAFLNGRPSSWCQKDACVSACYQARLADFQRLTLRIITALRWMCICDAPSKTRMRTCTNVHIRTPTGSYLHICRHILHSRIHAAAQNTYSHKRTHTCAISKWYGVTMYVRDMMYDFYATDPTQSNTTFSKINKMYQE